MINLVLFFAALTLFGMVAAWIAENPGQVTMIWESWRIDTSVAFLVLATVVFALVTALILTLIRAIFKAPEEWSTKRQLKYHRKGLAELTYSVASLAASDVRSAELHTRKAEKLLGRTPLTLLLSAQIAKSQGNDGKTKQLLEQLLEHKETEYLAARSLSDAASKQNLLTQALDLAKRAHSVNPGDISSVASMVSLHIRMKQWQEALRAVEMNGRRGFMTRVEYKRLHGLTHLMYADALLAESRIEEALRQATRATKLLPDFVPATLLFARIHAASGRSDKAIQLLFKAWRKTRHAQLASTIQSLSESNPKKYHKILHAIQTHEADLATLWTCSACGHSQTEWVLHCPSCDGFDTLR